MKMSPMQANTFEKVIRLNADNKTVDDDYWILNDGGEVTICHQVLGESPKQSVTIPKASFDKMVRWYSRPQNVKPRQKP